MKTALKNGLSVFYIGYGIAYFIWRMVYTINPEIPGLSWAALTAEFIYFTGTLLFLLDTWLSDHQREWRLPNGSRKVDVLIPTYNENLEILTATLVGCASLTYPHETYLLDDGHRVEVKKLALQFGVNYLTRIGNEHGKAGNLNSAIPQTRGEYLVVLDCDMVPQPQLIERALGYFVDEKIAIVQFPQEFYNLTSVQHDPSFRTKDGLWHEQSFFFRALLPGRDRRDGCFWCGSPAMLRRSAIEAIGGIATDSVTEDLSTSVRLNSAGYVIAYCDERQAYGLAPESLESFFIQRHRWCKGACQVYLSRHTPFFKPGLTLRQRLFFLSSQFHYVTMFPKFFYLALPVLMVPFQEFPIRAPFEVFLGFWLPFYLMGIALMYLRAGGFFLYFYSEIFALLNLFNSLKAVIEGVFFPRQKTFRVTPKEVDRQTVMKRDKGLLIPHFILVAFLLLNAYLLAAFFWQDGDESTREELYFRLFGLAWIGFSLINSIRAIRWVTQRTYTSRNYRFPARLPARIYAGDRWVRGEVQDLNMEGLRVRVDEKISAPVNQIEFVYEGGACASSVQVRWQRPVGPFVDIGISFKEITQEEKRALVKFLYVILPGKWSTARNPFRVVEWPAEWGRDKERVRKAG